MFDIFLIFLAALMLGIVLNRYCSMLAKFLILLGLLYPNLYFCATGPTFWLNLIASVVTFFSAVDAAIKYICER